MRILFGLEGSLVYSEESYLFDKRLLTKSKSFQINQDSVHFAVLRKHSRDLVETAKKMVGKENVGFLLNGDIEFAKTINGLFELGIPQIHQPSDIQNSEEDILIIDYRWPNNKLPQNQRLQLIQVSRYQGHEIGYFPLSYVITHLEEYCCAN